MSNIHQLYDEVQPRPKPRTRGAYRRKATAADITRAVRAAEQIGLTIYGLTLDGEKIHLQTKPGLVEASRSAPVAEDWFARRG